MSLNREELQDSILEFMTVLHGCCVETTYTRDRPIYAQDMVEAMGWIVELRDGADAAAVIDSILSDATAKHMGDAWREGRWGEMEAAAFEKLKARISGRAAESG